VAAVWEVAHCGASSTAAVGVSEGAWPRQRSHAVLCACVTVEEPGMRSGVDQREGWGGGGGAATPSPPSPPPPSTTVAAGKADGEMQKRAGWAQRAVPPADANTAGRDGAAAAWRVCGAGAAAMWTREGEAGCVAARPVWRRGVWVSCRVWRRGERAGRGVAGQRRTEVAGRPARHAGGCTTGVVVIRGGQPP
jgi:hypothetical protein